MRHSSNIRSSEITPKEVYLSRRDFIKASGLVAGSMALAACAPNVPATESAAAPTSAAVDELGDPVNSYEDITNYNNYYEFTTDKQGVAGLAKNFTTAPWTVEVGGLVQTPKTFGVEDLLKLFPIEERVYRLRCVEAWSMVIPWNGFPLAKLLEMVAPTSDAKYVRFESVYRPAEMPGQDSPFYPWPYQEGLRLDEAMNDLTLLATGLYGEMTLPQNGAPLRLVVPWKYGFKSIKSIVKIELVAEQPKTLWNEIQSNEYGFYANVNPAVNHPRWSQASERRIGELTRRPTLPFNGYAEQVADLYKDMDLSVYY
ncbi:MAG: protein-methionine-sulfoxide reductase catalytic subunit MsrP [Anaerolineales bacterium]